MVPKLKAAILESNPTSVVVLRHCISIVNPEIEICGDAANFNQAIALIETQQPDIIFLDIELKDGLGFQVVDIIRQKGGYLGELVFTSATECYKHVLQAIEYACLDFIPKPITESAVHRAIERAKERCTQKALLNNLEKQKTPKKSKLIVPTAQNTREAVDVAKISYFEAKGQCTILHLSDRSYITSFRILGYFKKLLADDRDFYQIHHALFINAEHVKSFRGKTHEVTMKNGAVLEASRRMTSNFKIYWDEFIRQSA